MLNQLSDHEHIKIAIEKGIEEGIRRERYLLSQVGYVVPKSQEMHRWLEEFRKYAINLLELKIKDISDTDVELFTNFHEHMNFYLEADYDDLISALVGNISHKTEVMNFQGQEIDFQKVFESVLSKELV